MGLRPVGLIGDLFFTDLLMEALGSFLPIFMFISSGMQKPAGWRVWGIGIFWTRDFEPIGIFPKLTESV